VKDKKPLANRSIMVTRPQHQATFFQQILEEKGANVILFPTLVITPLPITLTSSPIGVADILIFTSPNAVNFSHALLTSPLIPLKTCSIAAIGKKTATTLNKMNIPIDLLPQHPYNSESLLKHSSLQSIINKIIIIIKGEGGRNLLSEKLRKRGAKVIELAVYKRKCPIPTQHCLNQLKQKKIDMITLTSSESAYNLFTLLNKQDWLPHTPLLVGSPRIQQALHTQGINNPFFVASNPSDETMLQTLLEWNNR
jgi:uroporphyrinogen-III synthase